MKKLIALFLCLVMLFSVVSCSNKNVVEDVEKEDTETTPVEDAVQDIDFYAPVLDRYRELLEARKNAEELSVGNKLSEDIEQSLLETVKNGFEPSLMGYATKDINDDGMEELVLLDKVSNCYALFTLNDKAPVLLMDKQNGLYTVYGSEVYSSKKFEDESIVTRVQKLVDGKLEGLEFGRHGTGDQTAFYKVENGVRTEISYDEHNLLGEQIMGIMMSPNYYTKLTGFRYISAIDQNRVASDASVADFSSYDAVLKAYKTIVDALPAYTRQKWQEGEFDRLFIFEDNQSYDVFHNVFRHCVGAMPTKEYFGNEYAENSQNAFGYGLMDIDKNGTEELVLLGDNYDILAVFTMKDDKAVYVEGPYGWLDGEGYFHVEIWKGGLVDRDGEGYLYRLDGAELKCEVGVGYKVNIYLEQYGWYKIENGKTIDVSDEEGKALYARYDTLPDRYSEDEYMREVSGLEFIPLYERARASEQHLKTLENLFFVNGSAMTVSAFTDNTVTFEFNCVDFVGEFVPEQDIYPEKFNTVIAGEGKLNNGVYTFEKDGVKGYIEFGVSIIWVIVTESSNEHVKVRPYFFNYDR